jgi:hypothetical protein
MVLGLGAIALDRTFYGLVLITAFSVGLAGTLVAIGLAVVLSGRIASRVLSGSSVASQAGAARLLRLAPIGSATVVSAAGLFLAADAAAQLGLATLWSTPEGARIVAAIGLSLAFAALAAWAARLAPYSPQTEAVHAHAHHGHGHGHAHHTHAHP